MKKIPFLFIFTFFTLVGIVDVQAQPGGGGPGGGGDPNDPVPITGVEWLLIAGAGFGAKKLYDKKQQKK